MFKTYLGLELGEIDRAQGVSLGNNGDQVDSRAQSLHDFDIQRLQGVASGSDEVQASVDTKVNLVLTAGLLLLKHIRLVLVIQELDDGHPGISVVHVVAKAGGINDSQADYEGDSK